MNKYVLQTNNLSKALGKTEVLYGILTDREHNVLDCIMRSGISKARIFMKKVIVLLAAVFLMAVTLAGCSENDDTIQTCIVSNVSYTSQSELETANQADTLTANEPIYASIHFVESPKGMEYTVKWYLDGTEIKSDAKTTEKDAQEIIIYELEAEKAKEGSLKLEVIYKDTILLTKELSIQ